MDLSTTCSSDGKSASGSVKNLGKIVLAIGNISCAGCIPKIEAGIKKIPGIESAQVNSASHRAHIVWDKSKLDKDALISRIESLGWHARPYQYRQQELSMKNSEKRFLTQILLAAGLGMQVMMITVAMYFGDFMGMEDNIRYALRIAAMCLTIPILLFSARPFIGGALNSLKRKSLSVDVPVALALILAFAGSVASTFWYPGEVYYESVVMFTLLLLSARYLELLGRKKGLAAVLKMEMSIPETACRILDDGHTETIDVGQLRKGDIVAVGAGEIVAADGVIESGISSVNEAIITGESTPLLKSPGDNVIAGSINIADILRVRVERVGNNSVLGRLISMTENAQSSKPRIAQAADRIALHFVAGLIVMALFAGIYWWYVDQSLWLPVVISTLVVACPCALSLATPTAFVATMSNLTSQGILSMKSDFIEGISDADTVVFDKTGTLTSGEFSVEDIRMVEGENSEQILDIAAAVCRHSSHPVSRALSRLATCDISSELSVKNHPGGGLSVMSAGQQYALGSISYIRALLDDNAADDRWLHECDDRSVSLLARDGKLIARFELADTIRSDAHAVIQSIRESGREVAIFSGDNRAVVKKVAESLGVKTFHGGLSPQQKLEQVQSLQKQGKTVVMVGDGLNDAPILAAADYGIAMGGGSDLSKISADVVLAKNNLRDLLGVFDLSNRTARVIQQNYTWATAYNLLAIPAAVFGLVPPWAAALGMSISSLVVVTNSLRLSSNPAVKQQDKAAGTLDVDMVKA